MAEQYTVTVYNTVTSEYEEIAVSKAVYDEYRRGEWRIDKNNEKHSANETPFSALIGGEDGSYENFDEFVSDEGNPERIIAKAEQLRELREAIETLNESDRALVKALFFEGMNDYEYAEQIGVSHQCINKRKKNILKKLKSFFDRKGC